MGSSFINFDVARIVSFCNFHYLAGISQAAIHEKFSFYDLINLGKASRDLNN
jgi:hypothetical protein